MSKKEPAVGDRVLCAGEDDMHEATIVKLGQHREALIRNQVGAECWYLFVDLEWVNSAAPDRDAVIRALAEADGTWNDQTGDGAVADAYVAHLADALIARGMVTTTSVQPERKRGAVIGGAARDLGDELRNVHGYQHIYRDVARAALTEGTTDA
jgi:hypothetical protein